MSSCSRIGNSENINEKKNIVVCGAGIIGITTAYYLARSGHSVTCLDRAKQPATVASWKNGAFLDPALYTSWADHALLTRSFRSILDPTRGFGAAKLKLQAFMDPIIWGWGVRFFISSFPTQTAINGRHIRELCFYSMTKLRELQRTIGDCKESGMKETARGTFEIFLSSKDFQAAIDSDRKIHVGESAFPLHKIPAYKASEMVNGAIEPDVFRNGVLFSPNGSSGDVYKMSMTMYKECLSMGVKFRLGTEIDRIEVRKNRAHSVVTTTEERITGDAIVLALGSATPTIASTAGVHLCMIPVKGYVIEAPISKEFLAKMPLKFNIYAGGYALISPLGRGILRISGGADFVGHDSTHEPLRAKWVFDHAKELFPSNYVDEDRVELHTCLRPMSADDVPFIGKSHVDGLYVNAGHGSKGFTQCFGASSLLADLISDKEPEISLQPYSPNRFRFSW